MFSSYRNKLRREKNAQSKRKARADPVKRKRENEYDRVRYKIKKDYVASLAAENIRLKSMLASRMQKQVLTSHYRTN
jgi:hypothetical protein